MSGALADFIRARIAEDEVRAQGIHDIERCGALEFDGNSFKECDCGCPGGVLAECEAKRRIVSLHPHIGATQPAGISIPEGGCWACKGNLEGDGRCPTLRALALPYADHPDYREEWKP